MCDHPKLRTFELVDKVAVFVNRVTAGFPRENCFVEMLRLWMIRMSWGLKGRSLKLRKF